MSAFLFWIRFLPYTLLTSALLPLAHLFFAAAPRVRGRLRDRIGRPDVPPVASGRRRIVLHGASFGDVRTLEPVLERLQKRFDVVVSTMTASGADRARSLGYPVAMLPLENFFAARAWLRRLRPSLMVFEYLEIWPSVLAACRAEGVPVACHNVHLNPKSVAGLRLAGWLVGPFFDAVEVFLAQSPLDRWRLRKAGAASERIEVTGDTKRFTPDRRDPGEVVRRLGKELGWRKGQARVVFGSYQPREEDLLLAWIPELLAIAPRCQIVVAPRYPGKDQEFLARLRGVAPDASLRSSRPRRARVVVLDTMGELAAAYGLAQVGVVMGSFFSRGGQNPMEPARAGIPILYGPSMENFRDEVKLLEGAGAETVPSPARLVPRLREILHDPSERRRRGMLAQSVVAHLAEDGRRTIERNVAVLSALAERSTR